MPANPKGSLGSRPRILIAGLRGSGGKTLVSVGLSAAWREQGLTVVPFKKGADYIDAGWLAAAAQRPCRNLDLFMVEPPTVRLAFQRATRIPGLAVIEGNRGLFDGMDVQGTYSSAELAKLLQAPVVLVCDCSKTTRTLAAMIRGCQQFDPDVEIRGVILNQVAGDRHEALLRDVVGRYCGLPVMGVIPRLRGGLFPERHLGLVPPQEHPGQPAAIGAAARVAREHLDLEALRRVAESASPLSEAVSGVEETELPSGGGAEIGVLRDEAFQFYYPENLEAIERAGGRLVELSPLREGRLPPLDALYIGGGFPESFAERLEANRGFRSSLAAAVDAGLPVYAECAGAVFLGKSLVIGERTYAMAGALPVVFGFEKRPQGHGYAVMEVIGTNPFFPVGESIRGHEFHYTRVLELDAEEVSFAYRVRRGYGVDGVHDGLCRRNVLATYCHLHALGVKGWARSLVGAGASGRQNTRGV